MDTTQRTLSESVSDLFSSLSIIGELGNPEAKLDGLRKAFSCLSERLKVEIVEALQMTPPVNSLGEGIVDRYGWKGLYHRSFTFWFSFYVSWIWIQLGKRLDASTLHRVLNVWVLGTIGYRLLDLFLDEGKGSQSEAIAGLWLIDAHEAELRKLFGDSENTTDCIRESKTEWFAAELREKTQQGSRCPISPDDLTDLATKAAPIFALFRLALSKYSDPGLATEYKALIYKLIAVTQILDDLADLEDDLSHGFFTLPCVGLEDDLANLSAAAGAALIRDDDDRMRWLYGISRNLVVEAADLARNLRDPLFEAFSECRVLILDRVFFGKEVLHAHGQDP